MSDVETYAVRVEQAGGVVHRAAEDIPGVGDPQGAIFVLFQPSGGAQPTLPPAGTPGYFG